MNSPMHLLLGIFLSCLLPVGLVAADESLGELYPNRLITSDFGIVTADDLAYDVRMRNAEPYNPEKTQFARYWQCFPVQDVTPRYRVWRGEDGMGPWNAVITLCDLEIDVRQSSGFQIYGDRRAHPNRYCRAFERNWRKLAGKAKIVCLNGDNPSNETDKTHGKYRSWTWNKVKTRKGCYAYFGDCDVTGCAKGNCPTE